jgi:prepilin peptidase CpaA
MLSIAWLLFAAILIAATVTDIAVYRIPNAFVLALTFLFFVLAALHSPDVNWLSHLSSLCLVFGAGIVAYALGQMGAGDVKLLAVTALWSGLYSLMDMLFWVAICGLIGMMVILSVRRLLPKFAVGTLESVPQSLPQVFSKGKGIPYGIAIGSGAILASFHFPQWLWQ